MNNAYTNEVLVFTRVVLTAVTHTASWVGREIYQLYITNDDGFRETIGSKEEAGTAE